MCAPFNPEILLAGAVMGLKAQLMRDPPWVTFLKKERQGRAYPPKIQTCVREISCTEHL